MQERCLNVVVPSFCVRGNESHEKAARAQACLGALDVTLRAKWRRSRRIERKKKKKKEKAG